MIYPSNKKIDTYTLGLIEAEMTALMPEGVREGCHKVVAALDFLMGYYGRYDIFIKSVKLDAEALIVKHNGLKFYELPLPLRNKLIRSFKANQQDIYKKLDEMKNFLAMQQKLMQDMTDAQYEHLVELQEEFEAA